MKSTVRKFIFGLCLGIATSTFPAASLAQTEPPIAPKPPVVPRVPRVIVRAPLPGMGTQLESELRLTVDPNVNVKFCVTEGDVKVNGWDREELRVFVRSGREATARVLEKNQQSGKASWVWLTGSGPGIATAPASDCLSGSRIEIDVPRGTTLNVQGRSADVLVDTVKKVSVKIVEGNIALRNIPGGIAASALQGDLVVENSGGAIMLDSTTGNIFAYDVAPGQIGDLFRSKTNSGAISLQKVSHRQIEANTITGSVVFDGGFLAGGIYNFKTSNGSIGLTIPEASSCKIVASYGFGSFETVMPLKFIYRNEDTRAKNLAATLGSGESCNLNLTTTSGSISLRKQ